MTVATPAPAATPSRSKIAELLHLDFSSTPTRMASTRNIAMFLSVCFFGFFMAYQGYLMRAFKTIGRDSAPSIVMAEQIRYLLADANADAYLAASASEPKRSEYAAAAKALLDQSRTRFIDASSNITYGDEERVPLDKLGKALGAYDQALGSAAALGYTYDSMAKADAIMRDGALPAASDLAQANFSHLDQAFSAHSANAWATATPALAAAVALLFFLLWAQIELFHQTNRLLNRGYLAASFACGCFFLLCAFYTLTAESALRTAKKDAFDSVHALWMAKSVAYQAKSERAAMLLAQGRPADIAERERQWTVFAHKISELDSTGLRMAVADSRKFGGYLGDAFGNITFEGEKEALLSAAKGWESFSDIDKSTMAALSQGKAAPGSAAAQDTLGKLGSFASFDAGLDSTIAINQKVFDQEVDIAMARLSILPWLAFGMLGICLLGCFFGSKPRIDEYHF